MFITGKCKNCKDRKEYNDSFCSFCMEHDYCSYRYDDKLPLYSYVIAKQIISDCIMELNNNAENMDNKKMSAKLQSVLTELDKMRIIE